MSEFPCLAPARRAVAPVSREVERGGRSLSRGMKSLSPDWHPGASPVSCLRLAGRRFLLPAGHNLVGGRGSFTKASGFHVASEGRWQSFGGVFAHQGAPPMAKTLQL